MLLGFGTNEKHTLLISILTHPALQCWLLGARSSFCYQIHGRSMGGLPSSLTTCLSGTTFHEQSTWAGYESQSSDRAEDIWLIVPRGSLTITLLLSSTEYLLKRLSLCPIQSAFTLYSKCIGKREEAFITL